jgi:hypothetical protein
LFARDAQGQNRSISEWFHSGVLDPGLPLAPSGRPINVKFQQRKETLASATRYMKALMFYRLDPQLTATNAGLRPLDQSWRLRPAPVYPLPKAPRYRDEAVLVARTPMLTDRAEVVTEHGASPSRLWLGRLPDGQERPELSGFITQETYLRVFIPVH